MRLRVCVLLMGLLAAPAIPRVWNEARAADNNAGAGAPSSGPNWHIQRLLVPAERPEDWPRDKTQRYLPMPADEFEARVAELRKPSSQGAEVACCPAGFRRIQRDAGGKQFGRRGSRMAI